MPNFLKVHAHPIGTPKGSNLGNSEFNHDEFLTNKKRDPGVPMITSEIEGMTFTRSLLDTGASINILPNGVFDRHHW